MGAVGVVPRLSTGSIAVGHGLSCSSACGIFLDQESNLLSPALVGGFFTTDPPGKLRAVILNGEVEKAHLKGPSGQNPREVRKWPGGDRGKEC